MLTMHTDALASDLAPACVPLRNALRLPEIARKGPVPGPREAVAQARICDLLPQKSQAAELR